MTTFWFDGTGRFDQFDSDIPQHLWQRGHGKKQGPDGRNEMRANAEGHI
jgi:hypothetical protein